jgi:hypothetical protein
MEPSPSVGTVDAPQAIHRHLFCGDRVVLFAADVPLRPDHNLAGEAVRLVGLRSQLEGFAEGANLEEPAQVLHTREEAEAFSDGTAGGGQGLEDPAPQRLGDLASPLQASVLGWREGFHGGLDALAAAADAQGVARAVEAPVLRVVVGVDELLRLRGYDGEPEGRRLLLQPAVYGPEIGCVELPLDLLVVEYLLLHVVGITPASVDRRGRLW